MINTSLKRYISTLTGHFDTISNERSTILRSLEDYIVNRHQSSQRTNLIFICTHNSRRSQFAQIWAQVAAYYFNIKYVQCYSGGTEATAFNENAVNTIKKVGFAVVKKENGTNPTYFINYDDDEDPIIAFSKVYDDAANPPSDFAAIMVCGDAEENCPFIPGAEKRISLNYEDPKKHDGTELEEAKYEERCHEIAIEMFYVFSKVQERLK